MFSFPLPLFALFASAIIALWLALVVMRRRSLPGSHTFVWLMGAVAVWSATSAQHWLAGDLPAKIAWAQVQYVGIAGVPALFLIFAAQYAGVPWASDRRLHFALAAMGVGTFGFALTNAWHGLVWPSIALRDDGVAVYTHGAWFWLAATYHYALLLVGTFVLVQALRHSPTPFRKQLLAVLAGCLVPWFLNLLYLSGWLTPAGFDTTPIGFTATGVLIGWAVYRNHLFDLIPVARDQLVESLSDAMLVLDSDGRVLDMNTAARALSGNPHEWLGRPVEDLLPFLAELSRTLKSARYGGAEDESSGALHGAHHRDTREPTQMGPIGSQASYYDVRASGVRLSIGRYVGWLVLLRDVTEQRRVQWEREALEKRIQEQQKRESLSVLAGGLAHDFNNLLTGIIGNADLLALKVSPVSEMGSSVGAILLGAQRAADIVSKMLAYAGERHGASELVNLDDVMREMLELLQASAARHCTLRYKGEPVTIFADPVRIRQVAMNLIINASEAVEEDTGIIEVTVGTGELTAFDIRRMRFNEDVLTGAYAYLEVRDNGSGMDEETLAKIFTPFFTTKPTGHGLGLAAVQGIVRSHRGGLHIQTEPGAGTYFRVWLPTEQRQGEGERLKGEGLGQAQGPRAQGSALSEA